MNKLRNISRNRGKIIIISGPSGSGKTTLHHKLLKSKRLKGKLIKSISATTREKRKGERNGTDYLFLSKKMFLYKIKAGHFLEYERLFDSHYGTPRKNVESNLKSGQNVLLCIDVMGAKTVIRKYPDAVTIFIKTPSMSVLRKRLTKRGSEDKEELNRRLARASKELGEAKNYRHVVVNNDLKTSYGKLEEIILKAL